MYSGLVLQHRSHSLQRERRRRGRRCVPVAEVGEQTYTTYCAACHQPNGQGVAGHLPWPGRARADGPGDTGGSRLSGAAGALWTRGPITANGKTFNGAMPAWATLNDAQLAGALDYVLHSWNNDQALPRGFSRSRPPTSRTPARKLTADQVYALRGKLMPAVLAPAEATAAPTFTQEQADRGHALYRRNCQDCHGFNLNDGEFGGAPLNGQYFARHWGNGHVAALYGLCGRKCRRIGRGS